MDNLSERQGTGPSIVSVVIRHWWVVVTLVVIFGVLGYASSMIAATSHEATAVVVVQDPQGATLFASLDNEPLRPDRYVSDQAAVLASTPIAQATSDRLQAAGFDASVDEIVDKTAITTTEGSNVIVITYTAADADLALAAVNSLLESYEDSVEATAAAGFDRALTELEASLARLAGEIETLETQVSALVVGDTGIQALRAGYIEAIDRIAVLQEELPTASLQQQATLQRELADLERQLARFQAVVATQLENPELAALNGRLSEAVKRESDLLRDRSALIVDAALVQSGIAQASPAVRTAAVRPSPLLAAMAGIILGTVIGAAFAYWQSQRRRQFEDRFDPKSVFSIPLLAEVPPLLAAGDSSKRDASPDSAIAKAFRVLSSALAQQLDALKSGDADEDHENGEGQGGILAVVSANSDRQRAAVAVRTALATARTGGRVLIVDGGYAKDWSSEFLSAFETVLSSGEIPEAVEDGDALTIRGEIEFDEGSHRLDVMGVRNAHLSPSVFSSSVLKTKFENVALEYDLVLLDVPPLLTTAHAGIEVRQADHVMVVIPHRSSVGDAEELRNRLDLLGVDPVGYVYVNERLRERIANQMTGWTHDVGG